MTNIDQMVNTIEAEVRYTSHLIGKRHLENKVIHAMREVPRDKFVSSYNKPFAYDDTPLPIGHGQTLSQPYMVALMTDLLQPETNHTMLEIGTGCGYQTAVLSRLIKQVYSIEIIPELSKQASKTLSELGYLNIELQLSDGYYGWPEHAPYDGIIVTAAASHFPQPLIDQLKPGAKLIIPIGLPNLHQELFVVEKDQDGNTSSRSILGVAFVPLTGENLAYEAGNENDW